MHGRYGRMTVLVACGALVAALAASYIDGSQPVSYNAVMQHESYASVEALVPGEREAALSSAVDADSFASHLPVVSIDTSGASVPGAVLSRGDLDALGDLAPLVRRREDGSFATVAADGRPTAPVKLSIFWRGPASSHANRLTDEAALSTDAEMRVRGHSSRHFDKLSYSIEFTEADRATERDLEVLDMGVDDNWVLNGPFLDKTLLRNYVAYTLAAEVMAYTPDVRFCELFLDGVYRGVYLLTESIKVSGDRVDLTKSDPRYAQTSYIVKRDWSDSMGSVPLLDFMDAAGISDAATALELVYPSVGKVTPDQFDWIERDLDSKEKAIYSRDYDSATYGIDAQLDIDSFIDYVLLTELTLNADTGSYSTYFYRDARGPLAVGPVWDFNNAFNNSMDRDLLYSGFTTVDKPLFEMLYRDDRFCERLIARWRELREDVWSDERINELIDGARAYLGPAIERNYLAWGYTFDAYALDASDRLSPEGRNPVTYGEAVEDMRYAALYRASWLDANIEHLRMYSHESAVRSING